MIGIPQAEQTVLGFPALNNPNRFQIIAMPGPEVLVWKNTGLGAKSRSQSVHAGVAGLHMRAVFLERPCDLLRQTSLP